MGVYVHDAELCGGRIHKSANSIGLPTQRQHAERRKDKRINNRTFASSIKSKLKIINTEYGHNSNRTAI